MVRTCLSVCAGLICFCTLPVSAEYPISGVNPDQRPAGAPVIEWVRHDQVWFEHALSGVQKPYPRSLYFLENQGYWYTPFTQPGMLGKYDIRGWHKK